MKKAVLGFLFITTFASTVSAQTIPSKFNVEFGMGLVSAKSKTDSRIVSTAIPVTILGGGVIGGRSKISMRLKEGLDDLFTGRSVELNGRQHVFSVKNLSTGVTGYYFFSQETDTFRLDTDAGYMAQTKVRKHALSLGADLLYGSMQSRYIRGAYAVGAMYLWKDGVFTYADLNEPIIKLGDWDFVPADMVMLEGKLPLWRLEISGSARSMRTLNVADMANTKGLVPFRHTVVNTSVYLRAWKALGVSAGTTYTNNNHGTAFLGNSKYITLVLRK